MWETWVWLLGLGRSPGEGKGYLLQYSGLENSMDCVVHRVAKSQKPPSKKIFCLFMATLGLCCYAQAFSGCSEQGCSLVNGVWLFLLQSTASRRLSSVVAAHRVKALGAIVVVPRLSSPEADGIFTDPCTDMQILNHWTTRQVFWDTLWVFPWLQQIIFKWLLWKEWCPWALLWLWEVNFLVSSIIPLEWKKRLPKHDFPS